MFCERRIFTLFLYLKIRHNLIQFLYNLTQETIHIFARLLRHLAMTLSRWSMNMRFAHDLHSNMGAHVHCSFYPLTRNCLFDYSLSLARGDWSKWNISGLSNQKLLKMLVRHWSHFKILTSPLNILMLLEIFWNIWKSRVKEFHMLVHIRY